jgi:hypothetical protein
MHVKVRQETLPGSGKCFPDDYHDRRASEDAVFALRELTRRVNAKK